MKVKIFVILNIITFSVYGQDNCAFVDILPLEHGISKFKAAMTIASLKNIQENKVANNHSGILNPWRKYDYLEGDSVLKSFASYKYINHECFNGDDNTLDLYFVDDKLYWIRIKLIFSNIEYKKFWKNYNNLVETIKNRFIDSATYISHNPLTKEQIGEGYNFYPALEDKYDDIKLNKLSIGYVIEYESRWSDYKKDWHQTGNIDRYVVNIEYINLKDTKLTNKGF